jgi:nucleoside-diphosphate-sugar epimerase
MRVLIVGGANFIGPPVVRRLVGLGHEVSISHRGENRGEPGQHIQAER